MVKTSSSKTGRCKTGQQAQTEARVEHLLGHKQEGLPIWVRFPARGPERYSGLTRPYAYQLASLGLIQSRSVTQPGKVRGCRLFNLPSILEFIEKSGSGKAVVL